MSPHPIIRKAFFRMKSLGGKPNACGPDSILESIRGPLVFPRLTGDVKSWFALYVQVNHEKEIASKLEQKSVDCFLPLMECWSKRKDRRKRIVVPFFPGYVFVHTILDNYTNLNILRTSGVVNILKNSEGPLPIPVYQIENLQTILNSSQSLAPHPYLKEGEWVRVIRGPLSNCMGILKRHAPKKGRLVVSVDCIRQALSVELDVEDVEPSDRPPDSPPFL
jgi:transcription termination/antitermination protein NusG